MVGIRVYSYQLCPCFARFSLDCSNVGVCLEVVVDHPILSLCHLLCCLLAYLQAFYLVGHPFGLFLIDGWYLLDAMMMTIDLNLPSFDVSHSQIV